MENFADFRVFAGHVDDYEVGGCVLAKSLVSARKLLERRFGEPIRKVLDFGPCPQGHAIRIKQGTQNNRSVFLKFDFELFAELGVDATRDGEHVMLWSNRSRGHSFADPFTWQEWDDTGREGFSIKSLSELTSILGNIEQSDYTFLFRGHSNYCWGLVSELDRKIWEYRDQRDRFDLQRALLDRFYGLARPHLPAVAHSGLEQMAIGRHYGLPTMLLDWSTNPLVGLYFAVSNPRPLTDAALVWKHVYVGDATPVKEFEEPESEPRIYYPPMLDQRMISQSSVFTLEPAPSQSNALALERDESGAINRIHIPADSCDQIARELRQIGFSNQFIFPGLEGICKDLTALDRFFV